MFASLSLLVVSSALLGATLADDVARIELALRRSGASITRLLPHFAEAQHALRVDLADATTPLAACHAVVLVGPASLAFRAVGQGDGAVLDGRSTRGVLALSVCGEPLPSALDVQVTAGRGALEARVVDTADRLDEDLLILEGREAADTAREAIPLVEALPAPAREGFDAMAGVHTVRLDADRFGRATVEEPWGPGCRRVVVRAESSKDPADLDVVVDGPGASRWLEDKGPASLVDRVVCTPALDPVTVRISDATPGAALRIDEIRLPEIPALEHLRRPLDMARLSAVLRAARLDPTARPAVVLQGSSGSGQVVLPRERGRCEAFVITFVDGRRSPRAALVTAHDRIPFLRVGDGAGLALARCTESDDALAVVTIDATSPWTLASVDLGKQP